MQLSLSVVPRREDMNDVSWLLSTRKYISRYSVLDAYKLIYNTEPNGLPTVEEMVSVFNENEQKEAKITVKIVSHSFDSSCVDKFINENATKDFGIALAIEFRMLNKIVDIADDADIFLYLTEYTLNKEEIPLISENGLMSKLALRIIDKSKVMYTTLASNFETLLIANKCDAISLSFISRYIEHAHLYGGDSLLQYILESYKSSHPLFEELDCLAWDPFTMSRRYRHWLNVINRMDELSTYYFDISGDDYNIIKNKQYINKYLKFRSLYSKAV